MPRGVPGRRGRMEEDGGGWGGRFYRFSSSSLSQSVTSQDRDRPVDRLWTKLSSKCSCENAPYVEQLGKENQKQRLDSRRTADTDIRGSAHRRENPFQTLCSILYGRRGEKRNNFIKSRQMESRTVSTALLILTCPLGIGFLYITFTCAVQVILRICWTKYRLTLKFFNF